VIIDFGFATNFQKQIHYAADWTRMSKNFSDIIPIEILPEIEDANARILLHSFFQTFKDKQIGPEALIRIFAPITV
jgi:hypothetical protein